MMDWANERWVRIYTRDSTTWKMLDWKGRALLALLMRKVTRAGELDVGGRGPRGMAAVVEMPVDVTEDALAQLIAEGVVVEAAGSYVIPKFLEAQESVSTPAHRSREYRERQRDVALGRNADNVTVTPRDAGVTSRDEIVTPRDAPSRAVTPKQKESKRNKPKEEKNTRSAREPSGPLQECIAYFTGLFATAYGGQQYDWRGKHAPTMADLVTNHGADEVKRRTDILFTGKGPHWLKPPFTVGTLSSQWNHLAAESNGSSRAPAQTPFNHSPTQVALEERERLLREAAQRERTP